MKRFYKNTLIGRVSSYTLRVVALLCVLIGVSSSAWAGTGFHVEEGKALSLNIGDNWYDFVLDGHTGVNHLGNYISGECPKLNKFYYRTWKKDDNVCQEGYILVNLSGNEKSWGSTNSGELIGTNDQGYTYERWTGDVYNTDVLPTTPGYHTFDLYVKAKVGNDCSGWIWMNNGGSDKNYKFSYTVCKPMYFYGDGATGAWNEFKVADPTSDINIVRFELKELNKQFRFSRQSSFPDSEWEFFRNAVKNGSLPEKNKGAEVIQRIDNQLQDISVKLTEQGIKDGYSEPVYFYYNTSDNTYWVEATKKTTYSIEFEDGSTYSCAGTEEGVPCIQNIELGKGTYRFKIYKNDEPYKYTSVINDALAKQDLDSGDDFTTINVSKYSNCTFTINDTDGIMYLTVSSEEIPEPVLISYNPQISTDNKSVDLHGYLQGTLCDVQGITNCGFVFCAGGSCIPTSESTIRTVEGSYGRGDSFTYTASTQGDEYFIGGVTYGYRAYVKIGNTIYLSRETGYFRLEDDCVPQECCGQQTVTFTIDASLGEDYENDCKLVYGTLQKAIDKLQDSYNNEEGFKYVTYSNDGNHSTYNLNQPVVFNVRYYDDTPNDQSSSYIYRGTTDVGGYAGEKSPKNSNLIKDINRSGAEQENTLTIKAGDKKAKPWIHHIVIRNSKNIVLDSLAIFSDPADYDDTEDGIQTRGDNAIEIDVNDTYWKGIDIGKLEAANILIQNCMIGSDGFTGIHVSGYDGVTFKNNDFEAIFTSASSNDINWGASAKFIACKNIKFVQNNFRGDHATLMWLQETQNVLLMNNVFWNTNNYVAGANSATPTAIRLVAQYAKNVQNVGCYYNTFYLAENEDKTSGYKYNFLQFTNSPAKDGGSASNIVDGSIAFKYNNCYSYAENCEGKDTDPFLDEESEHYLCPNNFWSEYDELNKKSSSVFAFGDCQEENKFINVREQVCKTTASGPASLIVKGHAIDLGSAPTSDEINLTGLTLESGETLADRYQIGVRKGSWTYGAYQSRDAIPTETIYWVGISEDWDDRNNWEYETKKDPNDTSENPEMIRQRVSCVNTFSENLKVIVEEVGTVEVSGGRKWPKIPEFNGTRSNSGDNEHVNAGLGLTGVTPTKFAQSIELEYGAAIKGVENLVEVENNNNISRYGSATTNFVAPRSKWILVGPIVLPFADGENLPTRNIVSGDYYVQNRLPNVYMHKAEIINEKPEWNTTFAELDTEVLPNEVSAIMVPDQYGEYKIPANYYFSWYGVKYDPTEPLVYPPFKGRFINEKAMISFSGLTVGKPNLLNNSYPCSIDAKKLEGNNKSNGTVQYYDSDARTFKTTDATPEKVLIKPQQGFVFTPKSSDPISVNYDMLDDGNTRSRSAEIEMPLFSLNLYNANNNTNNSNIVIRYDEFLGEGNQSEADVEKAFSPIDASPELYIMAYDKKYSSIDVSSTEKVIPLGVRLLKSMNVRFEKVWFRGFSKVTLLDKAINKEYDLLTETYTTQMLEPGDIEGRFFLYFEEIPEEDNEEGEEGDDTATSVEENSNYEINIFVRELDNAIRVITDGVELETIYVSDMAGRTMRYDASGYSAELTLPVPSGVYIIQVMGDKANRTEKVILK
ncbi:MAG: T9SS type A sorting domain-containing protein [Paludibacteraceae bacterium]|nr:T9SS type A sorting domain-containing protein [Paludibacteraceae bacterium]